MEKIQVGRTKSRKQIVYTIFSPESINEFVSALKERYEGLGEFIKYDERKSPGYACIKVPKKDKVMVGGLDAVLEKYMQKSEIAEE